LPSDAADARSPRELRESETSTQKKDLKWVIIQTNHRLRKSSDVKMKSLGQNKRQA